MSNDLDSADLINLRKSLRATREALDRNTEALERSVAAQNRFSDTFEDALTLFEQLMPVIEGMASGNKMVGMVLPVLKSLFAKRAGRKR